jgi:hypothetical protein
MRFFLEAIPVTLYLSAVAGLYYIYIGEVIPVSFCWGLASNPMRFFLEAIPNPVPLYCFWPLFHLYESARSYLYLSATD